MRPQRNRHALGRGSNMTERRQGDEAGEQHDGEEEHDTEEAGR